MHNKQPDGTHCHQLPPAASPGTTAAPLTKEGRRLLWSLSGACLHHKRQAGSNFVTASRLACTRINQTAGACGCSWHEISQENSTKNLFALLNGMPTNQIMLLPNPQHSHMAIFRRFSAAFQACQGHETADLSNSRLQLHRKWHIVSTLGTFSLQDAANFVITLPIIHIAIFRRFSAAFQTYQGYETADLSTLGRSCTENGT